MILGGVNAVLCGIVLRPLGETAAFRGATYHLPAGAAEDGPRSRNPVWQNYALECLRSGTAVVIARFSSGGGGFSLETFRVIQSWPEIGRRSLCHSAAATVICCGQRQLNQLSKPTSAVAQAVFLLLEPAL